MTTTTEWYPEQLYDDSKWYHPWDPAFAKHTAMPEHDVFSQQEYDPYAADRYHKKCLAYLRRVIYDPATIMDENLFAATVVLRFLEEIDGMCARSFLLVDCIRRG